MTRPVRRPSVAELRRRAEAAEADAARLRQELAEAREEAGNWRERYEQANAFSDGCMDTIGTLLNQLNEKEGPPAVMREPSSGTFHFHQPAAHGRQ